MDYCAPRGIAHSEFLSWSETDQDKALEWAREQTTICSCGTRRVEWERDRFAYVSDAYTCPGCELLEEEQKHVPEQAKGVRLRLTPRTVFQAMHSDEPDTGAERGLPKSQPAYSTMSADRGAPDPAKVATFESVSG